MVRLPVVTGAQALSVLQVVGFEVVRQRGSHVRLRHPEGRIVTVPVHAGKDIGPGFASKNAQGGRIGSG